MTCEISIISFISMSKLFQWNIEESIDISKTFEWSVGTGPLYWFRVEFTQGICLPNMCLDTPSCVFLGSDQHCCSVISTTSINSEIWHVLATGVDHLCDRLNQECCNRRPQGFIRKVQKYLRPALCCDVEKMLASNIPISDEYIDVNYRVCECANFIDPCEQVIFFPCSNTPCSTIGVTPFTFTQGFQIEELKPIINKVKCFSGLVPSLIKVTHNLGKLFGGFLKRNNLTLVNEFSLIYSKNSDSWKSSTHLTGYGEDYVILLELISLQSNNWRFNLQINKSRLSFIICADIKDLVFEIDGKNITIPHHSLVVEDKLAIFNEKLIWKIGY